MTRHTRGPFGLVLSLSAALGTLQAQGSNGVPVARAHPVATAPVIDGRLNDPAWREATAVTGFIQRELHEGAPVTERTEVRIMTDGQALYVGAWLYDSDPAGIVAGERLRDGDITKSDYFGILLDTYHDRQNGFVFTTTPAARCSSPARRRPWPAPWGGSTSTGTAPGPSPRRGTRPAGTRSSGFRSRRCATARASSRRGDSISCAASVERVKRRSGRSCRGSSV